MTDESATGATGLVVMGVTGVGKTTIATALAEALDAPLAEADAFHSPANIEKMSAGTPLTDVDRQPWLSAIRDWITESGTPDEHVVVSCSALKRSYRDVLRQASARVRFVHLTGTAAAIGERLTERAGHFMPESLLSSQLAALEPLEADEDGIELDIADTPERITRSVLAWL